MTSNSEDLARQADARQSGGSDWTELPPLEQTAGDGPTGIGGWLILPIIGLSLTIVTTLVNLAPFLAIATWETITGLFAQSGLLVTYVFASFLGGALLIGYAIFGLVSIFRKHPATAGRMQIFYILALAVTLMELAGTFSLPDFYGAAERQQTIRAVVQSVVACAIWIWYFRVSKRVRNTFGDGTDPKRTGDVFA